MIIIFTASRKGTRISNSVFVVTWAWIALINKSNGGHVEAQAMMQKLREQKNKLLTSEFVLMEVANALSDVSQRTQTIRFINALRQNLILQIVPLEQTILEQA